MVMVMVMEMEMVMEMVMVIEMAMVMEMVMASLSLSTLHQRYNNEMPMLTEVSGTVSCGVLPKLSSVAFQSPRYSCCMYECILYVYMCVYL